MSEELAVGDRVELLEMPDDPHPVEPGTKGTIRWVNTVRGTLGGHGPRGPFTQYHVDWENGSSLMLVVPPDRYRKISSISSQETAQ